MREVKIELPVPLPSWNRVLSMHPYQRKKLRDLLHEMVELKSEGEEVGELCVREYMVMIRPSAKNKKALSAARSAAKRKG